MTALANNEGGIIPNQPINATRRTENAIDKQTLPYQNHHFFIILTLQEKIMYKPFIYGAIPEEKNNADLFATHQPLSLDSDQECWHAIQLSNDDPKLLELIQTIVAKKYASGELKRFGNIYCPHGQFGLEIHVSMPARQDVWEALFLAIYRAGAATILMRETADGSIDYHWAYPTSDIIPNPDGDIAQLSDFPSELSTLA